MRKKRINLSANTSKKRGSADCECLEDCGSCDSSVAIRGIYFEEKEDLSFSKFAAN